MTHSATFVPLLYKDCTISFALHRYLSEDLSHAVQLPRHFDWCGREDEVCLLIIGNAY